MLKTIEGIYQDGQIQLSERPENDGRSQVLVTFLDPSKINPSKLRQFIESVGDSPETLEVNMI